MCFIFLLLAVLKVNFEKSNFMCKYLVLLGYISYISLINNNKRKKDCLKLKEYMNVGLHCLVFIKKYIRQTKTCFCLWLRERISHVSPLSFSYTVPFANPQHRATIKIEGI